MGGMFRGRLQEKQAANQLAGGQEWDVGGGRVSVPRAF